MELVSEKVCGKCFMDAESKYSGIDQSIATEEIKGSNTLAIFFTVAVSIKKEERWNSWFVLLNKQSCL